MYNINVHVVSIPITFYTSLLLSLVTMGYAPNDWNTVYIVTTTKENTCLVYTDQTNWCSNMAYIVQI